nr:ABC transporter substrate binding protein [Bradyrhizobium sp. sGM-13]
MKGLRELGYIEGRDFDIMFRLAASTEKLPEVAREVIQLSPNVIFAAASANALAAKQATSTIPIVVAALANLTALGLSETDLRRPTGNLTGIMPYVRGLPAKQLEIAREIVPGAQKVGIVNDTTDIKAAPQWDEINATAATLEIKIVGGDTQRTEDVDPRSEGLKRSALMSSSFCRRTSYSWIGLRSPLPQRQLGSRPFMDTANSWMRAGSLAMELICGHAIIALRPTCTRYSKAPPWPIYPLSSPPGSTSSSI